MKRLILIVLILSLCFPHFALANLSTDEIRELNSATPGTFKVQLGTVLSQEQANIDTNASNISVNSAAISAIEGFTSDIVDVAFLTTNDTSLTLTNVAYVRKWTGTSDEGIALGAGTAQQVVTFSLALENGGDFFITPDTSSGFSQITLSMTGDTATLKYINGTLGWLMMGVITGDTGGGVVGPLEPFN